MQQMLIECACKCEKQLRSDWQNHVTMHTQKIKEKRQKPKHKKQLVGFKELRVWRVWCNNLSGFRGLGRKSK